MGLIKIRHVKVPVTDLRRSAAWYQELLEHGGVQDRGPYGANLDIPDPDGTVVRFLANNPINPGTFLGVEFDDTGQPTIYDTPRLR